MAIFGVLASRASESEGDIQISYEEYQELCEAVNGLPPQSQSNWDDVILNFVYQGRALKLPAPVAQPQGGNS